MSAATVETALLRRELAADLGRGGYVLHASTQLRDRRYFEKALVLSRPGLVQRAAKLLAVLVPGECERLAVTTVPAAVLGGAVAHEIGVPLLLGELRDAAITFEGEAYPGMNALLLEDVLHTGSWALRGAQALIRNDARLLGVVGLLDRDIGAAQRLADAGISLRTLFVERELLGPERVAEP